MVISQRNGDTATSLPNFYHCAFCEDEDFDICNNCTEKGLSCHDSDHSLRSVSPISVWLPHAPDVIAALKMHAVEGIGDVFRIQATRSCDKLVLFQATEAAQGSASERLELEDTVAVLLGCRVPVILHKCGSAYRLVSDAYVDGFMDGETIDKW